MNKEKIRSRMTNNGKQADNAGSGRIPQRESTCIAGPSREVSQTDNTGPVRGTTGPVNDEPEWAEKHMPGHRPAKSVFRKTELLGIAPPTEPEAIKKARQRILKNIRDPDGEVAYRPFEDAFRDFTCSLVQRQERVYDEMLLLVADLQQRIDALEHRLEETRCVSPGDGEVRE
jgi:hypothetical protein